jgi:hypothetical protein
MNGYVRISDEKDARWHQIRHGIRMDRLREDAERNRVTRAITKPDRCPHCGHPLDTEHRP